MLDKQAILNKLNNRVGKHWKTVSLALLLAIGGGVAVSQQNNAHASTVTPTASQTRTVNGHNDGQLVIPKVINPTGQNVTQNYDDYQVQSVPKIHLDANESTAPSVKVGNNNQIQKQDFHVDNGTANASWLKQLGVNTNSQSTTSNHNNVNHSNNIAPKSETNVINHIKSASNKIHSNIQSANANKPASNVQKQNNTKPTSIKSNNTKSVSKHVNIKPASSANKNNNVNHSSNFGKQNIKSASTIIRNHNNVKPADNHINIKPASNNIKFHSASTNIKKHNNIKPASANINKHNDIKSADVSKPVNRNTDKSNIAGFTNANTDHKSNHNSININPIKPITPQKHNSSDDMKGTNIPQSALQDSDFDINRLNSEINGENTSASDATPQSNNSNSFSNEINSLKAQESSANAQANSIAQSISNHDPSMDKWLPNNFFNNVNRPQSSAARIPGHTYKDGVDLTSLDNATDSIMTPSLNPNGPVNPGIASEANSIAGTDHYDGTPDNNENNKIFFS